ncbi:hypothetical protein [Dongia sp.]|uniref:hypothetical protein n=1 Tax=Dongia sp. TaxID=1977262 RepID=UPI0035B0D647
MCTTAAAMAASMIVSTGVKMATDAQQANHESRELEREAKVARAQGAEQERQLRQQAAREQSKRRAAYLKGGVTTEGSATDVLLDAAREDDVEARWARFGQTEGARAKEREARFRRRRSVLDQLSTTSSLGTNIISLKPWEKES